MYTSIISITILRNGCNVKFFKKMAKEIIKVVKLQLKGVTFADPSPPVETCFQRLAAGVNIMWDKAVNAPELKIKKPAKISWYKLLCADRIIQICC
jgi:hypothetical protein